MRVTCSPSQPHPLPFRVILPIRALGSVSNRRGLPIYLETRTLVFHVELFHSTSGLPLSPHELPSEKTLLSDHAKSSCGGSCSLGRLGIISAAVRLSESASEDPAAQHDTASTPLVQLAGHHAFVLNLQQHLDLVFFSISNSRHARLLASICLCLPSLHCVLFPSLVSAPWFCSRLPAYREFTQTI